MAWFIYGIFFAVIGAWENLWGFVALGTGCVVIGLLDEKKQQKIFLWIYAIMVIVFLIIAIQKGNFKLSGGGGGSSYGGYDDYQQEESYDRNAEWR